jgi:hypothetical protein
MKFPLTQWLVIMEDVDSLYYFDTRTNARKFKGRQRGEIIKVVVKKAK